MEIYDHKKIEKKWQDAWEKEKFYKASDDSKKPKFYQLETFPYPSAAGLHVGHPKGYIAEDIHARFMRGSGREVLYTMGWDAFGLPTENYAIKVGKSPQQVAEENIANFKRQVKMFGLSYDWDREINTSAPEYYKWTQWLFIQLFKAGLAYRKMAKVNWCPKDQTVLANEQVVNGRCERCGELVEQKEMEQWFLKITDYAERLLNDLEGLDWPQATKLMQRNWIGRSEGALIKFYLTEVPGQEDNKHFVEVFTTRPDTIFGATFAVVSPELAKKWMDIGWQAPGEIKQYIDQALAKKEIDRTAKGREKTGVEAKIFAINPATNEKIPVWIADYVLGSYGTGAIMAVPAHDERDFEFAKKFKLPIVKVIEGEGEVFIGDGKLVNSGKYSGQNSAEALPKMAAEFGVKKVQYKIRDWSISRQRYWGAPIPMIHCEKPARPDDSGRSVGCGIVPVAEKDLPVLLPDDVDYRPKGKPPLASSEKFMNVKCPNCGGDAKREPETLDTFVDSSWYYLRYTDPHNGKEPFSKKMVNHWMPVDLYIIGAEHSVLHLLYSRFITKFLFDQGFVKFSEPFLKLRHLGLILGDDGQKMSKSKGNVVNPDEVVDEVGADSMRIYEMFMGPFEDGQPWNTNGLIGARRFLDKVWRYSQVFEPAADNKGVHKLIKKITSDIPNLKFNTAIAAFMEFLNENKQLSKQNWETFLILLAPFAPHITEELWAQLGHKDSIHKQSWPKFDEMMVADEKVTVVVQVSGKVRASMEVATGMDQQSIKELALKDENVKKYLEGKDIVKEIFVKDRLINFVVK